MADQPTERAVFVPSPFVRQPLLEDAEREARRARESAFWWRYAAAWLGVLALVYAAMFVAADASGRGRGDQADIVSRSLRENYDTLFRVAVEMHGELTRCQRERDAPSVLHVRPDGSFMWTGTEVRE